jgi:rare lipoprotein A
VFRSPNHAGAVNFAAMFCCFALLFAATACGRRTTARIPAPPNIGDTETGIASWYGEPYNGRRAASGEIYDMEKFTAAHRTVAFGTWLEVTDLDNGKRVEVRVIDRGPFVAGRVIDLSLAAARKIDMVGPGTARVQLKIIPAPQPETSSAIEPSVERYSVQAGAFSTRDRAESFEASLREQFEDSRVVEASTVWRVLVGHGMTRDDAKRLADRVKEAVGEARVVPDR